MKRFAAGVVAAATALSLSTGVASAQTEGDLEDLGTLIGVNGVSEPHQGSAKTSSNATDSWDSDAKRGSAKAHIDFNKSSWENDAKNGYALGTTADILWGVGIAAAVLGAAYTAVQNGLIPGVSLPF